MYLPYVVFVDSRMDSWLFPQQIRDTSCEPVSANHTPCPLVLFVHCNIRTPLQVIWSSLCGVVLAYLLAPYCSSRCLFVLQLRKLRFVQRSGAYNKSCNPNRLILFTTAAVVVPYISINVPHRMQDDSNQ